MPRNTKTVIAFAIAMLGAASSPSFAQNYHNCPRLTLHGNQMSITNTCSRGIYVNWVDGRGEHTTAIGGNSALNIGRVAGQPQITGVQSQFGD